MKQDTLKKTICMIVPNPKVKGGIAAVTGGYYGSRLEDDFKVLYIQSYCDGSKLRKLFKALGAYLNFFWTIHTRHIDLVHIHSSFGPSFYRKKVFIDLAARKRIPIVNHIHGADFDTFYINAGPEKKRVIEKCYGKCSRLIALSDEWKEKLSKIVDESRIIVIPNYSVIHADAAEERAFDADKRGNLTEGFHVGEKTLNILFLGELGSRKGVFDIPDIARLLREKCQHPRFILAGAGSEEDEKSIKTQINNMGLQDMFSFPGWIRGDQKDEMLRKADIFFLPSYNEGMPMSILDACGYGLPIISTNVGGIPKIVDNEYNGFLYTPGDKKGMADGLYKLCVDEGLRHSYGRHSLELVKKDYSLESHLEKLEQIWSDICEK